MGKEVVLEAVKKNGAMYHYISDNLKKTTEIFEAYQQSKVQAQVSVENTEVIRKLEFIVTEQTTQLQEDLKESRQELKESRQEIEQLQKDLKESRQETEQLKQEQTKQELQ